MHSIYKVTVSISAFLLSSCTTCTKFIDYQNTKINVTGIQAKLGEKSKYNIGDINVDKTKREASEELQRLDLLQFKVCSRLNEMSDSPDKTKLQTKYIEHLINMEEIIYNIKSEDGLKKKLKKSSSTKENKEFKKKETKEFENNYKQYNITELIEILNVRAGKIVDQIELDIKNINTVTLKALQDLDVNSNKIHTFSSNSSGSQQSSFSTSSDITITESQLHEKISKETFIVIQKLADIKQSFLDLHKKHIESLGRGKFILARELSNSIIELLRNKYRKITANNIGFSPSSIGSYYHGVQYLLVDIRNSTGYGGRLDMEYLSIEDREALGINRE